MSAIMQQPSRTEPSTVFSALLSDIRCAGGPLSVTLSRLSLHETGMSFSQWRQQLHINLALQWLSQGMTVQAVAHDLGYEITISLVYMFRKVLGSSPARYMAQRLARSAGGGFDPKRS